MATSLASGPGACCVRTVQHEGTPIGSTIDLAGLRTYISRPASDTDKIVLFFPDIGGPFWVNNQLLMDYFASKGYLVIAPDYLEGEYIQDFINTSHFEIIPWAFSKLKNAKVTTPPWVDAVMKEFGTPSTKYVTIGYCFGASFALDLCATDKVVAGAIAHPSFLDEDHFRKVKQPLALFCAEVDIVFSSEARRRSEDILIQIKATYHYQLFSGVQHGFGVTGNMEVENERWAKEESARRVVGWWTRFAGNEDKTEES